MAVSEGVAVCGKYDMLLVAARSLHQDPLMVSLMPLLRVPPATPAIFRSADALMPLMPGIKRSDSN
jgi:hypothetical protein